MMDRKDIAIVGATGNVGRKLLEILIARNRIPINQLCLLASARSAGKPLTIQQYPFMVNNLADYSFEQCRLAIFATEAEISKTYIPQALAKGTKVVDASSAYRLDPQVPLIVPPVNAHLITEQQHLFSHANCLASPISVVLKPLHDYAHVTRLQVTTFQSVSGAGKNAMDELYHTSKSFFDQSPSSQNCFPRPIAFNVIPQVGDILEDGFSYEEFKIAKEIQKIISLDIKINATSVRVPVFIGHGMSLSIEFEKEVTITDLKEILNKPSIQLNNKNYATPLEVEGKDDVFVGRIRKDPTIKNGILLWLVSDNLRRGAALDEAELAEIILKL